MAREVLEVRFEYNVYMEPAEYISFVAVKSAGRDEGSVSCQHGMAPDREMNRTPSKEEWREMSDALFDTLRIEEWESTYKPTDVCVADGFRWSMRVALADGTTYECAGDNAVPEQWDDLVNLLHPYLHPGH